MLNNKNFWLVLAISYTLALLYFSLANVNNLLPDNPFPYRDKLFHLLAYCLLAFVWGYYGNYFFSKKTLWFSFFATLSFGIVLECLQEKINPLRQFEVLDVLANCLGVLIGTIIVLIIQRTKVKIT